MLNVLAASAIADFFLSIVRLPPTSRPGVAENQATRSFSSRIPLRLIGDGASVRHGFDESCGIRGRAPDYDHGFNAVASFSILPITAIPSTREGNQIRDGRGSRFGNKL